MRTERVLGIGLVLVLVLALAAVALIGDADSGRGPGTDSPSGERAVVQRVVDGDTIVVQVDGRQERVRYVGVDAPELANPETGSAAECWGQEARDANVRLVDGAEVLLERDSSDRDRFGRLLRHVWVQHNGASRLVAEDLAAAGAVEARSYPPDTRRDAELQRAEREARLADAGLWGGC